MVKIYRSNIDGKKSFVEEVISPLMIQAQTGWHGAEYEHNERTGEETVYLLDQYKDRCRSICVTGDSVRAIVEDVFKNL